MATCPLCLSRAAKRFCPAKATRICAICCGSKREIEIDCPSTCVYLKTSRTYEAGKQEFPPELAAKLSKFDQAFIYQHSPFMTAVGRAIIQERLQSPWLVDNDVTEVYNALTATVKTLSSGIYYDTLPDGPTQQSLFRRLRGVIDEVMKPQHAPDQHALKASEVIDVLDFLQLAAHLNSSHRPKSRRYLDWLANMTGAELDAGKASSLILP